MGDVFEDADEDIWASEFGSEAVYTAPSGTPVACRVLDRHSLFVQPRYNELGYFQILYGFRLPQVVPVRYGALNVDGQPYTLEDIAYNDGLIVWWTVRKAAIETGVRITGDGDRRVIGGGDDVRVTA